MKARREAVKLRERLMAPIRLTSATRHWVTFVAVALVVTSCAGGLVTDSETGQPVPGAQVTFHDSQGSSATTSANEGGLYAFRFREGPIPTEGMVTYEVSAPGYEPLTVQREVRYDDNPASTWEIQHFVLEPARITFTTDRDGNPEIYVMKADGTEQTRVTHNPAADEFPAWPPTVQGSRSTAIGTATGKSMS